MPGALQLLIEALLEAVWVVDASSLTVVTVNTEAARMLGRPAHELVGKAAVTLTASPEDLFFWEDVAAAKAHSIHSRTRLLHPEGHTVPVERRVSRVQTEAWGPVYLVVLLDRSEQERSQDEAERLLAELRATLDSTADALLVCNLEGQVRAFNRRFADLWQVPKDLLLRRDDRAVHDLLATSVVDADSYTQRLAAIAADPLAESSDTLLTRTGRMIERIATPQFSRGRPIGRVYAFRDITERVAAQAELRLAAKVFACSLDAIVIAGPDHRVITANPGCQRVTRVPAAELVGRPVESLFQDPHDERLFAQIQTHWAASGHWEGEVWHRRPNGSACAVQLTWVVLRDTLGAITHSVAFSEI